MSQKERFNSMAAEYDRHAEIIVPYYQDIQECICLVLSILKKTNLRVLDLGAGSGILLQRISEKFNAECVWQDFSEDFLQIAKNRLAGKAISFIISDLREPSWSEDLRGEFDAIVSSNAIHHLKDERKKVLYQEIVGLLAPGGVFLNADEIRGESNESYLMSLKYWDSHVRMQYSANLISEEMNEIWKAYAARNIERFPNDDPDAKDIHCCLPLQLEWLQSAGLQHVECFWKAYLWGLFGGFKPS